MRIAIYARYSSNKQNPKSTEDQINECKEFIAQKFPEPFELTIYRDDAIPGKYEHRRAALLEMKEAIRQRKFDIIVSEALDRISRSVGDTATFYAIVEYYDIDLWTIAEDKVTFMSIVFKAFANQMYISSVSRQVHRAQKARAKEGAMFGLPYGYKIKIENGREVAGQREIDEQKAEVVRMIFAMYARGHSVPSICEVLNGNNVPSPRGRLWTKHSLMGSRQRMEGILNNRIYVGEIIWNRRSQKTNPENGGINYPVNERKDWIVRHDEKLRIISDDLWNLCEIKKGPQKKRKKRQNRIINPLRGLLFCSVCKGHKNIANNKRYVCANYRQYRTCTNARGMNYDTIIEKLFEFLRDELVNQSKKGLLEQIYTVDNEKFSELEKLNEVIKTLSDSIDENTIDIPELADRLSELHSKRQKLENHIKKMITDKQSIETFFIEALNELENQLNQEQKSDASRVLLMVLLRSIIFKPTKKRTGEHMKILLHNDCWQEFYLKLKSAEMSFSA